MEGFPAWLNTKEDYLYVREHFPREQWEPVFQALLDERMAWLNVSKLLSPVVGIVDKTHKVVTVDKEIDKEAEYYQYAYMENKNCKLFRLGFTVEEVQQIGLV